MQHITRCDCILYYNLLTQNVFQEYIFHISKYISRLWKQISHNIYSIVLYCLQRGLFMQKAVYIKWILCLHSIPPNQISKPHKCNLIAWFKMLDCVVFKIKSLFVSFYLQHCHHYQFTLEYFLFIYLFIKQCTFRVMFI